MGSTESGDVDVRDGSSVILQTNCRRARRLQITQEAQKPTRKLTVRTMYRDGEASVAGVNVLMGDSDMMLRKGYPVRYVSSLGHTTAGGGGPRIWKAHTRGGKGNLLGTNLLRIRICQSTRLGGSLVRLSGVMFTKNNDQHTCAIAVSQLSAERRISMVS